MIWIVVEVVVMKVHSVVGHSNLVIGTTQDQTIVLTMLDVVVVQPQNIVVRILLPETLLPMRTSMRNFLVGKIPTVVLLVVLVQRRTLMLVVRIASAAVLACSTCEMSPHRSKEK